MKQNVSAPTAVIVLLMVAAILTAIWYMVFDRDRLAGLQGSRAPITTGGSGLCPATSAASLPLSGLPTPDPGGITA